MPEGNYLSGTLDSRDLIADFYPRLQAANESLWSNRIAMLLPSTRETEELAFLGQVPVMTRWIGRASCRERVCLVV